MAGKNNPASQNKNTFNVDEEIVIGLNKLPDKQTTRKKKKKKTKFEIEREKKRKKKIKIIF